MRYCCVTPEVIATAVHVLATQRLTLRQLCVDDAAFMLGLLLLFRLVIWAKAKTEVLGKRELSKV